MSSDSQRYSRWADDLIRFDFNFYDFFLIDTIEIIGGNLKKTIMIGDSETDSGAAQAANIPFVLIEGGYTEKKVNQIYHNHLVKNFIGLEKIIEKYLND